MWKVRCDGSSRWREAGVGAEEGAARTLFCGCRCRGPCRPKTSSLVRPLTLVLCAEAIMHQAYCTHAQKHTAIDRILSRLVAILNPRSITSTTFRQIPIYILASLLLQDGSCLGFAREPHNRRVTTSSADETEMLLHRACTSKVRPVQQP